MPIADGIIGILLAYLVTFISLSCEKILSNCLYVRENH